MLTSIRLIAKPRLMKKVAGALLLPQIAIQASITDRLGDVGFG